MQHGTIIMHCAVLGGAGHQHHALCQVWPSLLTKFSTEHLLQYFAQYYAELCMPEDITDFIMVLTVTIVITVETVIQSTSSSTSTGTKAPILKTKPVQSISNTWVEGANFAPPPPKLHTSKRCLPGVPWPGHVGRR
jgi:hypothetical protein